MDIALTGIGLRFPPDCNSPEEFWRFLLSQGDAISSVPVNRWDWRRFYDPDRKRPGKTYARRGGFLKRDLREFDPMVFGISPREAEGLDPQQRLLLESTWEAFEDAGIPIEAVNGTKTGVFIGGFCLDNLIQATQPANRHLATSHSPTSSTMTILSNRISYVFNLLGPSFTVDTACSSSLVALHSACRSLQAGDCTQALVGGVNAMFRPDYPVMMSKGQFLSDHANCRAFDASAAGYVRGEGAGVVVLKPLDQAIADGDEIYAVIKGTGVNQDGRTAGISLPNSEAQKQLMQAVYAEAGVDPATVDFIEAHGTGTQAGDPAEAAALEAVLGQGRSGPASLWVGSVKTNIGHLEAGAGVAGLIKAALSLYHRTLPANLHFKEANPKIPFGEMCLKVPTSSVSLPSPTEKATLYAGINSFGYGGTNGHAILASAPLKQTPPLETKSKGIDPEPIVPIPFSARSPEALREQASRLAFALKKNKDWSLPDIASTLAYRRSHLNQRGWIYADSTDDLRRKLMAASTGETPEGVTLSSGSASETLNPVFVCTGMGPQWWAMGHSLFQENQIARTTLQEIDERFSAIAGWSIAKEMMATETTSRMAKAEVAQPANFILQVALARIWKSWGVRPAALVGHSVGEVSSAYLAGVYTLEEAVLVSYHRSRLQGQTAGQGSMLAVGLGEAAAQEVIQPYAGVAIAAINSYSAVTLSGSTSELNEIAAKLSSEDIFNRPLAVDIPYHSPGMDPLQEELIEKLATLQPKKPTIPLYSTVTGRASDGSEWTAEYWWKNVREPVRFAAAIRVLQKKGFQNFLEVGPHPVLKNSIQEVAAADGQTVHLVPSLRRLEPELPLLQKSLATLYVLGAKPNWSSLGLTLGPALKLPRYPWQRKVFWAEAEDSEMDRLGLPGPIYQHQRLHATEPTWEVEINKNFFPFVEDHLVRNQVVFAGMGYVEAALALGLTVYETEVLCLRDVSFEKFLVVDPGVVQHLVSSLNRKESSFTIASRNEGDRSSLQRHAAGRIYPRPDELLAAPPTLETLRARCPHARSQSSLYDKLARRGLRYGKWFRPITTFSTGEGEYLATIDPSLCLESKDHLIHPTLLDAAIQPLLYVAQGDRPYVPNGIRQLNFFGFTGTQLHVHGRLTLQSPLALEGDVLILDDEGRCVLSIEGISCQYLEPDQSATGENLTYLMEWKDAPLPPAEKPGGQPIWFLGHALYSDPAIHTAASNHPLAESFLLPADEFTTDRIRDIAARAIAAQAALVSTTGTLPPSATTYPALSDFQSAFLCLLQGIQASRGDLDFTALTRQAQPSLTDNAVTSNPLASTIPALGTLLTNEREGTRFRSIDLLEEPNPSFLDRLALEIGNATRGEFAWKENRRLSRQLITAPALVAQAEPLQIPLSEPLVLPLPSGNRVANLAFEKTERKEPTSSEIEVRFHSAALNFKDYLKAIGRLHPLALRGTFFGEDLGMEAYGEVVRTGTDVTDLKPGDRVMGLLPRAFRTYATVDPTLFVKVPDCLGKEAAAIPVVYMTALYGMENIGRLQAGERILIHQATGGLGQAAIQLARLIGAEIFATAGSEEKRDWLRQQGIQHVYPSRDLSFVDLIKRDTGGEGVDLILSALAGKGQQESLALLRSGGRYIEVGKRDIIENKGLPLRDFNNNLSYCAVDMDRLTKENPQLIRRLLLRACDLFAEGKFTAGETRFFPANEVHEAFQLMAQSRHLGKVLLDLERGEVPIYTQPDSPRRIRRNGAYLITGGTAGFGLETAKWLARKGAGRIILLSRSGRGAVGLEEGLEQIEDDGCDCLIEAGDVTSPECLQRIRQLMSTDGYEPAGLIHGAMVLDDGFLPEMTPERFEKVFRTKVQGALALTEAFADSTLDFILFYSSISALIGNRGQANYIAANAWLDQFAHTLQQAGKPAYSINWGALAEAGVVARSSHLGGVLDSIGVRGLTNQEAFAQLETFLESDRPQIAAISVNWETWRDHHRALALDSRFQHHVRKAGSGADNPILLALREEIKNLPSEAQLSTIETRAAEVLSGVLRIEITQIQPESRLSEMGVDSLLLIELSLGLKERLGVGLSPMEFLKAPTVRSLSEAARRKILDLEEDL